LDAPGVKLVAFKCWADFEELVGTLMEEVSSVHEVEPDWVVALGFLHLDPGEVGLIEVQELGLKLAA
jgi:hypothetical protein